MALTISFANQKGGVGKTLTTSSVARILTLKGYKVLCVDMDPQRNLSMAAGKGIAIEPYDKESLRVQRTGGGRANTHGGYAESVLVPNSVELVSDNNTRRV